MTELSFTETLLDLAHRTTSALERIGIALERESAHLCYRHPERLAVVTDESGHGRCNECIHCRRDEDSR